MNGMSIHAKTVVRVIGSSIYLLAVLISISENAGAGSFDKDPIVETQTKTVPVTEETLRNEPKAGAPAPTFRLITDTGQFFVADPLFEISAKKKRKWKWWPFSGNEPDSEKPSTDIVSDNK
jgi:hypothetical protein